MSQVLEKPILLDETGQAIAGKLDTNADAIVDMLEEIKDAIGTSSEFIPVKIQVVTPPTKTTYKVGERLNLSGMVVNLVGTNGVQIDVTSACTFSPANNTVLTASDTAVTITYLYQHDGTTFTTSQALVIRELSSIAVTTPPIKTAYQTGETLDLTGIVVTATYSDGFTANVTSDCMFNPANGTVLSSSDTSVTITYVEGSITKTTSVAIGVKELVSIAVTHLPTKTSYKAGETLDLTGIVVTATYDDTTTLDVTAHCTFSPADGDTLTTSDTTISISYTEGTVTKTTSQAISVIELSSIAVTTPPTQTAYTEGNALDLTGLVVTATYSDNSTADVTSDCTFSPADGDTLALTDTTVTITYVEAGVTKTATQAITVEMPTYGVEWDGTATSAWTRTDDSANFADPNPYYASMTDTPSSPFDTIQPWAGMQRVTDSEYGELVSIPKFYYKLTQNGSAIKIQISNEQKTGFVTSPAHMDRGDGKGERDVVYVGRYHCADYTHVSKTGVAPLNNVYLNQMFFYDKNTSRTATIMDFSMWFTIWLLYLVEFADWNSQKCIGAGGGADRNMGYTDSMSYHTGTTQSTRATTGVGTQYRYIEGLWENSFDWILGLRKNISGQYQATINFGNNYTGGNWIDVGLSFSGYAGTPRDMVVYNPEGLFPFFFPYTLSSQSMNLNEYTADSFNVPSSYGDDYLFNGGGSNASNEWGLFRMSYTTYTGTSYNYVTYRVMKLPNS